MTKTKRSPKQQTSHMRLAGIGVELVGAVIGFSLLGLWIDHRYDSDPYGILICASLGLIGGMYNMIRQSLRAVNPPKRPDDEPDETNGPS